MLLEDFEDALDEYGTDLEIWPDTLRAKAMSLLEASAPARTLLEDEIRLDAALSGINQRPVQAPSGLADRIVLKALETSPAVAARPVVVQLRPQAPAPVAPASLALRAPRRPLVEMAVRYAAVMLVCFGGGVAASRIMQTDIEDAHDPAYVSGLYADLAY